MSASTDRSLLSRPTAFIAAVLMLAACFLWAQPVPAAQAITATNASGYPGDVVSITIQNQQAQGRVTWPINAAAQTTFAAVPASANPPGTQPFSCPLTSSTQAVCGPPASSWAAGNRVVAQLLISPNAPAGTYTGSTAVGNESTSFTVEVLAPPAPPIAAPAADSVTTDQTPTLSGSRRAGNSVTVTVDDTTVCTVPAGPGTDWLCTPENELAFGAHTVTATQTSPGGDTSPATTVSFTVVDQLTHHLTAGRGSNQRPHPDHHRVRSPPRRRRDRHRRRTDTDSHR